MTPSSVATTVPTKLSIENVLQARRIFSNDPINFPAELIDIILDNAEYWASIKTQFGGWMWMAIHAGTTGELHESKCLTSNPIPITPTGGDSSVVPQVREIVFRLRSHDQGISNNAQCRGTYRATHSWFTVGISLNGSTLDPALESKRWFLQSNVHGSRHQKFHEIVWSIDPNPTATLTLKQGADWESHSFRGEMDETTGQGTQATGLDFLRHLQEAVRQTALDANANVNYDHDRDDVSATSTYGVAVSIYACAQYGGWENHVSSAEVEMFCFV